MKGFFTAVGALTLVAGAASAQVEDYVAERSGNTWSLGNGQYIGLIGFNRMDAGTTVTSADLFAGVVSGQDRVLGFFNGFDNIDESGTEFFASNINFGSGDNSPFNGVDVFTSATNLREGRVVAVAFVLIDGPGNVVFRDDRGRTETLNTGGTLGAFPFGLGVIPAPGAAGVLAGAGLIAARRRR